jgi:hypothetical protein
MSFYQLPCKYSPTKEENFRYFLPAAVEAPIPAPSVQVATTQFVGALSS